ncbi:MAG TPA: DUF4389 domain-containing protein [Candidatus Nanopelagicaceae bacterium]
MGNQVRTYIQMQMKSRDRITVLFRAILIIPIAILADSFSGTASSDSYIAGLFFFPVVLTLLFRGVYPSYVLAFNKAIVALSVRIAAYFLLLTDDYPSIEANEKIGVEFPEIQGGQILNRWMPLVKWFLAIPLYVVGAIYIVYAIILTIIAWFTIIFTGEYPEWCANGVMGTVSYWNRVYGYAFVLVTDEYPSFSL